MTEASSAMVTTDRAARYGKQLVAHLSRRHGGEWSDADGSGWIDLGDGRVELSATVDGLALAVTSAGDDLDRLEDVVGRHLVRFGTRDELHVSWTRRDGTAGTVQSSESD
jgi:uncharacterized protein